jgi:plasmid maintenance system killer protein
MQVRHTLTAGRAFAAARQLLQKAFLKQVALLEQNLNHPSLHAKKLDEATDIWQARVNRNWRFYFTIENDTYTIHKLIPQPK